MRLETNNNNLVARWTDARRPVLRPWIRSAEAGPCSAIGRAPCVRYPVWQHTFVSPSAFSSRVVVSYWRKYVHEVLVNRLGGLSLPRKSVVRLTDRPDMTLDVYRGRKTTTQQQQQQRCACNIC